MGEAVAVAGVAVGVTAIAVAGIIAVEAAIEESVAEAATEPSVGEAVTEPPIAEAAVEPSTAKAAMEASTAAMETPSPSGAKTRHGWGRCDRKTEGKGRQGSGNRSEERCMHDGHSNLLVRARRPVGQMT